MERPLKIYGILHKNTKGYYIKLNKKRYNFYLNQYETFEKAKKKADEFLLEYSLINHPNIYVINDNIVEMTLKNTDQKAYFNLKDLEKVQNIKGVWRTDKISKNRPISKIDGIVFELGQYILDNTAIKYKDKNKFNCVAANLEIKTKIEHNHNLEFPFDLNRFWCPQEQQFYIKSDIWNQIKHFSQCCSQRKDLTISKPSKWFIECVNTFPIYKGCTFSKLILDFQAIIENKPKIKIKIIMASVYGSTLSRKFSLITRSSATHFNCGPEGSWNLNKIWQTEYTRKYLIETMLNTGTMRLNNYQFYNCYNLRWYIASDFPSTIAKYIYNQTQSERVLDFCSGWGGRLIGFWASNALEYVGIDPNTILKPQIYDPMLKWLQLHFRSKNKDIKIDFKNQKTKKVEFINEQAEKINYIERFGQNYFDLVFTSPPYFNTEQYSTEETQSYLQYPQKEVWMESFLFETIKRIYLSMKAKAKMIINIKMNESDENHFMKFMIKEMKFKVDPTLPNEIQFAGSRNFKNTRKNKEKLYCFLK